MYSVMGDWYLSVMHLCELLCRSVGKGWYLFCLR